MNIQEAIDKCVISMEAYRAKKTARSYQNGLNAFLRYLKTEKIDPPTPLEILKMSHFIGFPEWLATNKYSKKTMQVYISGVKFFLDWMVIGGHIEPTYAETRRYKYSNEMINHRREDKLPRFPALDDPDKMREAVRLLKYESPIQERNMAIIEMLISTGCRNNELCQLKINDFADGFRSAVVMGKGSKERRIFLSKRAHEAIVHYWKIRGSQNKSDPAFARHDRGAGKKKGLKFLTTTSIRNIVVEAAKMAGIENFTPHYFRHAFAIKMLRETSNLALVQDLLGHKSPAATRVYAKIYPADLEAAHKKVYG